MCYGQCIPVSESTTFSIYNKNYYFCHQYDKIQYKYVRIMVKSGRFLHYDSSRKINKFTMKNSMPLLWCKNGKYLTYILIEIFFKSITNYSHGVFFTNVWKYFSLKNS